MGVKERRERDKESMRQEILDAAREMFVNEGFQNVSMRKIADKIEYSPTTIYLYFKDKTDLLYQICGETFAQLAGELETISLLDETPLETLRKGLRTYIDFGLRHPKHYEITFMLPIFEYATADLQTEKRALGQNAFEFLRLQVTAAMKTGEIKLNDVELISQTLWAGIHGITSLLISREKFPFVNKNVLIESVINTMLEGLKK